MMKDQEAHMMLKKLKNLSDLPKHTQKKRKTYTETYTPFFN
jgi:inorganic pyrophosphatase